MLNILRIENGGKTLVLRPLMFESINGEPVEEKPQPLDLWDPTRSPGEVRSGILDIDVDNSIPEESHGKGLLQDVMGLKNSAF